MRIRYSKLFVGISLPALCTGLASLLLFTSANAQTIRPSTQKELKVFDPTTNGTGNIGLRAAAGTSSYTLTLPASAPSVNQVLSASAVTGGNVSLTWATPFTGSGTTNYVSKFATAGTLTNSLLFDNGTNIVVGTATPSSTTRFEIRGTGTTSTTTALEVDNINGGPLLVVRDDGNVGIGTTSPEAIFHIAQANSVGSTTLYIDNSAVSAFNNEATIKFSVDAGASVTTGGASISAQNVNAVNANTDLVFRTFGGSLSERMRITSGGNVGIGTTNPTATNDGLNSAINHDNSSGTMRPEPSGTHLAVRSSNNEAVLNLLGYQSNNNSKISGVYFSRINGQGDAHINVASIQARLAGNTNTAGGQLWFFTKPGGNAVYANSPQMVLDASGNVGIGTTSPGSKLDVKGTLRLSGATSGYVGIAPAAAAGSTTYTLPSTTPSVNQVLSASAISGSDVSLTWATPVSGTVTSVGSNSSTGLTGGPITTSGTLAIDTLLISTRAWRKKGIDSVQANLTAGLATKLNISDTASMLSPYARTNVVNAGLALKVNISDTASMLTPYLRKIDTTSMLSPYLRSNVAAATYVPQTRSITINGTSQDLTANRTYNVGTVTSVGATAGTGISVSGSPITSSGSFTITNTAPDQTVVLNNGTGISVSGTYPTFTITNTSPSSGGTVTSVGSGTGLSGGPITTSGTLSVDTLLMSTRAWRQKGIDSVAALANTKVSSVSGTAPISSSGGTSPTISISQASGSTNGFLSSTDWTTFNNKQNALTNPVTGTGTTNYLPKFTSSSAIGNSAVTDDGTTVTLVSRALSGTSATFSSSVTAGGTYNNTIAQGSMSTFASTGYGILGSFQNNANGVINLLAHKTNINQAGLSISNSFDLYTYNNAAGWARWASHNASSALAISLMPDGGNVGIGTTNPTTLLHIRKDQNAYTWARIDNQAINASAYSGLQIGAWGNTWGIAIGSSTANSNSLAFVIDAGGGNTERMRITSGGNVGIGATSPEAIFHIAQANSVSSTTLYIDNSAVSAFNNEATIKFSVDAGASVTTGGASISAQNVNAVNANTDLVFRTFGGSLSERMRITSGGNVGIGTTSPGSTLDVKGTLRLSGATSGYVGIAPAAAAGSTTYTLPSTTPSVNQVLSASAISGSDVSLTWATPFTGTGTTNYIPKFTSSSAIGNSMMYDLGTLVIMDASKSNTAASAPYMSDMLRLNNTNTTTNALHGILLTRTNGAIITSVGSIMSQVTTQAVGSAAADLLFYTAASDNISERMRITSGGNVGIGTTNPTATNAGLNSAINYTVGTMRPEPSGTHLAVRSSNSEAVLNLLGSQSTDNGKISGVYFSRINGQSDAHTNVASIQARLAGNTTAAGGQLWFFTKIDGNAVYADSPQMVLNTSGNVGIGTTSPSARLEVSSSSGGQYFNERAARILHSGAASVGSSGNFSAGLEIVSQKSNANGVGNGNSRLLYLSAPQYTSATSGNDYALYQVGVYIDDLMSYWGINSAAGGATYGIYAKGGGFNYFGGATGIGITTPGSVLQVNGNAAIGYSASTAAPTNGLAVSGNVGIGTTSPSEALDVNGNARFRSVASGSVDKNLSVTIDGTLTVSSSDLRLKTNITTIDNALEKVMKLRGVNFNWKDTSNKVRSTGFIAQEVLSVMPELVFRNNFDGYYGVNYGQAAGLFVEAIKEQQKIIDQLKADQVNALLQLRQLQNEIQSMRKNQTPHHP